MRNRPNLGIFQTPINKKSLAKNGEVIKLIRKLEIENLYPENDTKNDAKNAQNPVLNDEVIQHSLNTTRRALTFR